MIVQMRVMGYDIPMAKNTELMLPDSATIDTALRAYLDDFDIGLTHEEFRESQFLVNGLATNPEHNLSDGDKLTVMRLLGGG